ncbi:unnamed protein product [Diamesa serratosioi]
MASYSTILVVIALAMVMVLSANALQCYQCGQFNDGVGSITPCLNYSANLAHLHLKECSRKSDKFCVKYVSELSTVRDCVETCVEKEVWDTSTFCCSEDSCNGTPRTISSSFTMIIISLTVCLMTLTKLFRCA